MTSSDLRLEFKEAVTDDLEELLQLRITAMKPSLLAIDRYDPDRARARFSDTYTPEDTSIITLFGKIIGFYVLVVT